MVFQNIETPAMLVYQKGKPINPVGVERFSCINPFFFPINLHVCLPRECKRFFAHSRVECLSNISNTRDSASSGYPNTEKRVENTTRSGVFCDEIRGVWIVDEALSRVFDISLLNRNKN